MADLDKHQPTERFSNRAKLYTLGRPDYPEAALDFIISHCGLEVGDRIIDIGAGTGISTRAFAAKGFNLTAVEPNQAMLDQARQVPDFKEKIEFVNARAEKTGLQAANAKAIVCAQAFHWFDANKALEEFKRLLEAGGWVVLIWNERDEKDSFTKAYGDLLRTLPDTSLVEIERGSAGNALLKSEFFSKQERTIFANSQKLDLNLLKARAFSASYAPAPDTDQAIAFEQKLEELFYTYQNEGSVSIIYETSVYTGQKSPDLDLSIK